MKSSVRHWSLDLLGDLSPKMLCDITMETGEQRGGLTVLGPGEEQLEGLSLSSKLPQWGLRRFSFCLRLQNQTRTTSRSMLRESETNAISSLVGLGFWLNALSKAILIVVSMEVRFLRRLFIASCWAGVRRWWFKNWLCWWLEWLASASSSHLARMGFSLHMFLNERLRASNLDIVVWLKSLP